MTNVYCLANGILSPNAYHIAVYNCRGDFYSPVANTKSRSVQAGDAATSSSLRLTPTCLRFETKRGDDRVSVCTIMVIILRSPESTNIKGRATVRRLHLEVSFEYVAKNQPCKRQQSSSPIVQLNRRELECEVRAAWSQIRRRSRPKQVLCVSPRRSCGIFPLKREATITNSRFETIATRYAYCPTGETQ
jgi:hypothetical protein